MQQLLQKHAPMGLVFILALLVVIETGLLIGGVLYYQKVEEMGEEIPLSKISKVSPMTDQVAGSTAIWTTHTVTTDPVFGLADYTIKVPPKWKRIEHSSNFQGTEKFRDEQGIYELEITEEKNLNPQTGKPNESLRELSDLSYEPVLLFFDGGEAAQVLPRAGSEHIFKVVFFSNDRKLYFGLALETPKDGSKVMGTNEGEELFKKILSTFKFTD